MARFTGSGEAGPQGPQGIQGETGPQGIQGETGPQGIQGEPGEGFSPFRGLIWNQTGGTINIDSAGTYVPINLAGTLDPVSLGMGLSSIPNVSGLKNTSGETKIVAVVATYDGKAGNNHAIGLKLALNNTPIDASECTSFAGGGGQFGKTMTQFMLELAPNDEIAMWASNIDTSNNLTIARYKMIVFAV